MFSYIFLILLLDNFPHLGEQFRSPTPNTSSQAATGKDKGLVGVFPAQGPCWIAQRLGKQTHTRSNGYKEPGHGSRLRRGKRSPCPSSSVLGAVRDTRKMAPAGGKNVKKVSVRGTQGCSGFRSASPAPQPGEIRRPPAPPPSSGPYIWPVSGLGEGACSLPSPQNLEVESVLPGGQADSQVGGAGEVGCRGQTPGSLRTSERHPHPSLRLPSFTPTCSPLLFTSHYPGLAIINV